MQTEETTFFSDGLKLAASFFLPDAQSKIQNPKSKIDQPLVICCSGFTGLRTIHPARFARYLTAEGFACLGFDYRGFADSQGTPDHVLLDEQVRDIIHAAAFAAGDPRFDPDRIILLGWGMSAGLVLDAARELPGVRGIVAVNGFYNGKRVQIAHRGEDGYAEFLSRIVDARKHRVRTGEVSSTDPFDLYPLDDQSRRYVDDVLRKTPHYAAERYRFELAESLIRWRPEAYAPLMHIPLLIAHGDANRLHPPEEADALFAAYAGPKQLYWIEGAGHTEWMHDDNPRFRALGAQIVSWIRDSQLTTNH